LAKGPLCSYADTYDAGITGAFPVLTYWVSRSAGPQQSIHRAPAPRYTIPRLSVAERSRLLVCFTGLHGSL